MLANGLQQWVGDYPNEEHFLKDYLNNGLFLYIVKDKIAASISILPENDAAYKEIEWLKYHSLVIHRVLVDPEMQHSGIGMELFNYAIRMGLDGGYESIKVDTHPDNDKMQRLIAKAGFVPVGYLSGINRLAYEYVL